MTELKEIKQEPKKLTAVEKKVEKDKAQLQMEKAKMVATERRSDFFDPILYSQMKLIAQDFIDGGAVSADAMTPQQMIVKLQAGFELGLKPTEALSSLYMVNGRVNFWGAALVRRLRVAGWRISFEDKTDACTATVTKGDETYSDTLTFAEAAKSGYTSGKSGLKIGWKEGVNRKLKLRYGALSILIKTYIPEVLGSAVGVQEFDGDIDFAQAEEEKKEKVLIAIEKAKEPLDTTFKPIVKDKENDSQPDYSRGKDAGTL